MKVKHFHHLRKFYGIEIARNKIVLVIPVFPLLFSIESLRCFWVCIFHGGSLFLVLIINNPFIPWWYSLAGLPVTCLLSGILWSFPRLRPTALASFFLYGAQPVELWVVTWTLVFMFIKGRNHILFILCLPQSLVCNRHLNICMNKWVHD